MATKRLLIAAPLVLVAFLLQSWLWVPSYEHQTRGNPDRVTKFFEGSIGDAHFLNPVLSDETTGSGVNAFVFDTLLDSTRTWRCAGSSPSAGRSPSAPTSSCGRRRALPDGAPATRRSLRERIARARSGPRRAPVRVEPRGRGRASGARCSSRAPTASRRAGGEVEVRVRVPERDRDRAPAVPAASPSALAPVLGPGYLAGFDAARFVELPTRRGGDALRAELPELLPPSSTIRC